MNESYKSILCDRFDTILGSQALSKVVSLKDFKTLAYKSFKSCNRIEIVQELEQLNCKLYVQNPDSSLYLCKENVEFAANSVVEYYARIRVKLDYAKSVCSTPKKISSQTKNVWVDFCVFCVCHI